MPLPPPGAPTNATRHPPASDSPQGFPTAGVNVAPRPSLRSPGFQPGGGAPCPTIRGSEHHCLVRNAAPAPPRQPAGLPNARVDVAPRPFCCSPGFQPGGGAPGPTIPGSEHHGRRGRTMRRRRLRQPAGPAAVDAASPAISYCSPGFSTWERSAGRTAPSAERPPDAEGVPHISLG